MWNLAEGKTRGATTDANLFITVEGAKANVPIQ